MEEIDKEKRRYYDHLTRINKELSKYFTLRNSEKCLETLDEMASFT